MRLGVLLMISLTWWQSAAGAQELNPHRIYENSCGRCHAPHAGDFVWQELVDLGGVLAGKSSTRAVADFLEAGHGRISTEEARILMAHLRAVRDSGRLFREKCRICHESAADLARRDLLIEGGQLVGRYSGREIAAFLENHGRLDPDEVGQMLKVLRRVATDLGLVQ